MANLTMQVFFTRNTGVPAEGLALADIDLYLTRQHVTTGVDSVVWDGTQNPTEELDNMGAYARIYTDADLDTYTYSLRGTYTGAVVLDVDHVTGAVGKQPSVFPAGAIEYTYTVTNTVSLLPEPGVTVWVSTDLAGAHIIWNGTTDAFGVARDINGNLPMLNAGTYYFWKFKVGFIDDDLPDTEVVA